MLSVGSLLHSKHRPRKEPNEAREKGSLRGKQGSGAEPTKSHYGESRLLCLRNRNEDDAFHAQDG